MKMPEPINPVTFTGTNHLGGDEQVKLSVGRLHIGTKNRQEVSDGMHRLHGDEVVKKYITCILWSGDDDNVKQIGEIVLDEDHFVRGLQHLFPKNELSKLYK